MGASAIEMVVLVVVPASLVCFVLLHEQTALPDPRRIKIPVGAGHQGKSA